ncbi:hypothetical protein LINPERHAP1_LOCUS671 [Linum perenne]
MIILCWNCRGLGQPQAIQVVDELVKAHRSDVVLLIETLCMKERIEVIKRRLNFKGCFAVDVNGHSGGLAVLCRHSDQVQLVNYSRNFINLKTLPRGSQLLRGRESLSWLFRSYYVLLNRVVVCYCLLWMMN